MREHIVNTMLSLVELPVAITNTDGGTNIVNGNDVGMLLPRLVGVLLVYNTLCVCSCTYYFVYNVCMYHALVHHKVGVHSCCCYRCDCCCGGQVEHQLQDYTSTTLLSLCYQTSISSMSVLLSAWEICNALMLLVHLCCVWLCKLVKDRMMLVLFWGMYWRGVCVCVCMCVCVEWGGVLDLLL